MPRTSHGKISMRSSAKVLPQSTQRSRQRPLLPTWALERVVKLQRDLREGHHDEGQKVQEPTGCQILRRRQRKPAKNARESGVFRNQQKLRQRRRCGRCSEELPEQDMERVVSLFRELRHWIQRALLDDDRRKQSTAVAVP